MKRTVKVLQVLTKSVSEKLREYYDYAKANSTPTQQHLPTSQQHALSSISEMQPLATSSPTTTPMVSKQKLDASEKEIDCVFAGPSLDEYVYSHPKQLRKSIAAKSDSMPNPHGTYADLTVMRTDDPDYIEMNYDPLHLHNVTTPTSRARFHQTLPNK